MVGVITLAVYFISRCDSQPQYENRSNETNETAIEIPVAEIDKIIKEKYEIYELWGYYNGLMMPRRVVSENEWFKEKGLSYDSNMTCESVIDDLWNLGSKRIIDRSKGEIFRP